MTSVNVLSVKGIKKGTITLPGQFNEEHRPEIIRRAFKAQQSHAYQPYGSSTTAGRLFSVYLSKRRRKYRGVYGKGRSRTPRKVMWRRGTQFSLVGAFVPFAVGGRRAHPPKVEKDYFERVNDKERRKAIRSALSATATSALVEKKHLVEGVKSLPIVVEDAFENFKRTKEVVSSLKSFGLEKELERVKRKKVRAGKGKMRGRKYKRKVGPLIVTSRKCELQNAVRNIPRVEVIQVRNLNVGVLAPGSHAGRLTIFTKSSVETLRKEGLFK